MGGGREDDDAFGFAGQKYARMTMWMKDYELIDCIFCAKKPMNFSPFFHPSLGSFFQLVFFYHLISLQMRQNLLGCLVGFFFITIVLQKVAGRSLGFLRALAQEEAEEEQQLAFDDVEQTNMISHIDKFTPKSKKVITWHKNV